MESIFATARLRHRRIKDYGSQKACPAMVFKCRQSAQHRLITAHPEDLTISRLVSRPIEQ